MPSPRRVPLPDAAGDATRRFWPPRGTRTGCRPSPRKTSLRPPGTTTWWTRSYTARATGGRPAREFRRAPDGAGPKPTFETHYFLGICAVAAGRPEWRLCHLNDLPGQSGRTVVWTPAARLRPGQMKRLRRRRRRRIRPGQLARFDVGTGDSLCCVQQRGVIETSGRRRPRAPRGCKDRTRPHAV